MAEIKKIVRGSNFSGTTEKLFSTAQKQYQGIALTRGQSFFLTSSLGMFLSAPKENCGLWL